MPLRLRTGVGFAILFTVAMGLHFVLTDRGLEPASVVAKAWDQIDRISRRACTRMERALVTGAGPIGLLAALLARQRGLEVHSWTS